MLVEKITGAEGRGSWCMAASNFPEKGSFFEGVLDLNQQEKIKK